MGCAASQSDRDAGQGLVKKPAPPPPPPLPPRVAIEPKWPSPFPTIRYPVNLVNRVDPLACAYEIIQDHVGIKCGGKVSIPLDLVGAYPAATTGTELKRMCTPACERHRIYSISNTVCSLIRNKCLIDKHYRGPEWTKFVNDNTSTYHTLGSGGHGARSRVFEDDWSRTSQFIHGLNPVDPKYYNSGYDYVSELKSTALQYMVPLPPDRPWWKFVVWVGKRNDNKPYSGERKGLQDINWITMDIDDKEIDLLNTLAELVDAYTAKLTQNEALIKIAQLLLDPAFVDPRQIKRMDDKSGGCQYGDNCEGEIQHEVFAAMGDVEDKKEPLCYELASCTAHKDTMKKNMAAWLLLHDMYRFCDLKKYAGDKGGITMTSLSRAGGTSTTRFDDPTNTYATLVDEFGQNYIDYVCHTDEKAYNFSVALRQGNPELIGWIEQCRAEYMSIVTDTIAVS